ncbi:hypothetical protein J3Q64DRAFT_1442441 [Phycomyces blakesleeanus]|uniref:Uncharacterized protein n=1 Tax=Phycomyces blakesleeanus TaxID=4837 RepID=A0ABR3B5R0_PHYBL
MKPDGGSFIGSNGGNSGQVDDIKPREVSLQPTAATVQSQPTLLTSAPELDRGLIGSGSFVNEKKDKDQVGVEAEVEVKNGVAELELKLNAARAQIKLLEKEVESLVMNKSKVVDKEDGKRSDAVHQHLAALRQPSVDGYPPEVVLAVAGLVFIVTYLLF